jgi:hypothetical protein
MPKSKKSFIKIIQFYGLCFIAGAGLCLIFADIVQAEALKWFNC